ncbi:MAG: alcohol dehydrogenase catalytic domain-containing protein [Candidatus Woesearchaeota archaeon]
MLAAVYTGINKIELKKIDVPEINEEEALLKVKACSICGTDRKIYKKGKKNISDQQILGHEISGKLVKVGKKVKYYKEGMRVNIAPNLGCGYCSVCREGLEQLCPDYDAFGITIPGGFAEYLKIPASALRRGNICVLPKSITYEEGALVEPLSCCFNAYQSLNIAQGESMLIFGAGVMGNLHLLLNKKLGTGKIIMVDIEPERLEISKKFNADYAFLNDKTLKNKILDITNGRRIKNIIVAAPVVEIQKQALDMLAVGGKINFFAGLADDKKIPISSNNLHYKQQFLTGTTGSTVKQFRQVNDILANTLLNIKQMITKTISLSELPEVMADKSIFKNNMKIQVRY